MFPTRIQYKPRRTLTEWFVLGAIVLVLLALVVVGGMRACTGVLNVDHKAAEQEATKWAGQMGIEPVGVSCANIDSDGDGYVSCMVSSRKKDGSIELHAVECSVAISINSGCRSQRPGVTVPK